MRLFVFVGFSDDRRLALVVRFGVVVCVLVISIVIVGVSRRHRVAHDGDEFSLGRGKVLRDALGHVGRSDCSRWSSLRSTAAKRGQPRGYRVGGLARAPRAAPPPPHRRVG